MTPFTDQYTPEVLLATAALNCCVVLVARDAVEGVTVTPVEDDDELLELLPPPQAVRTARAAMTRKKCDLILFGPLKAMNGRCQERRTSNRSGRMGSRTGSVAHTNTRNLTRVTGERLGTVP